MARRLRLTGYAAGQPRRLAQRQRPQVVYPFLAHQQRQQHHACQRQHARQHKGGVIAAAVLNQKAGNARRENARQVSQQMDKAAGGADASGRDNILQQRPSRLRRHIGEDAGQRNQRHGRRHALTPRRQQHAERGDRQPDEDHQFA